MVHGLNYYAFVVAVFLKGLGKPVPVDVAFAYAHVLVVCAVVIAGVDMDDFVSEQIEEGLNLPL